MGLRRVPVYIYKRRRSGPKKSLAALALFRGTPSARRRYRHTSQQPNRPKNTEKRGSQKVSQNFLGRGGGTEQPWRIAKANRPESAVYGDEGAAERGVRANPLANRPAHTAARFPIFSPRFTSLSASSLSFLCSPVPCIRPRPSSRKNPRG